MNAEILVYGATIILTLLSAGSSFCRIANIDMKGVQYRYVAPFLLIFLSSLGIGISLLGGDHISWYQPVTLLAFCIYLWNTKSEWANGMPAHYRASVRDRRAPARTNLQIMLENIGVTVFTLAAIVIAGVGSAAGSGNPVQIYSSKAEPSAVYPGQDLELLYTFRRIRACPGYVNRFIVSAETGEIVQTFDQHPVGGLAVGRKFVDYPVTISLFAGMKPGRYVYRALMYSNCDDGDYTQTLPDIHFIVSPLSTPKS